ncbi:TPA: DUF2778 domain-containing protein [Salmonella enterica]|nr:DUF2778 domain-containing protein [Salmonella enterica]
MGVKLTYDGQVLTWPDVGTFKATTGYYDEYYEVFENGKLTPKTNQYQWPDKQCVAAGAIPEGNYKIFTRFMGAAKVTQAPECGIDPAWGWTTLPEEEPGGCQWSEWGHNRARLEPADKETKKACGGTRGGFYIHDSTKGYSHGCIEVEPTFFRALKIAVDSGETNFTVSVHYVPGRVTNGGTKIETD